MLIEFEEFETKCFPLTIHKDLFISKNGQIIKVKHYDLEYWKQWSNFIQEEIVLQIKMNSVAPNSFLKIIYWTLKEQNGKYSVYVLYESNQTSLNIESYVKQISDEMIQNLVCQTLQIGCELETKNVYHMNIKPNNFIIVDGQIKLTDFGSARILNDFLLGTAIDLFYSEKLLQIKQITNRIEQNKLLNSLDKLSVFRENDNWGLGIIISQIILQNFNIKQPQPVEEILNQIYLKKRLYKPLFIHFLQDKKSPEETLQRLISSLQNQKTQVRNPYILRFIRLQPINASGRISEVILPNTFSKIPLIDGRQNEVQQAENPERQIISISSNTSDRPFFDDLQRSSCSQLNSAQKVLPTVENLPSQTERYQTTAANLVQNNDDLQNNNQVNLAIYPQIQTNKFQEIIDQFQGIVKNIKSQMIVQFYIEMVQNKIMTNPDKHMELSNFQSDKLFYQNSICEYSGFQQSSKPQGFGIQYRKKEKNKLLIGLFNQGNIVWGSQIEEVNHTTIQHYLGDFDEKEIKHGNCKICWYSFDPKKGFTQLQSHTGEINKGTINGQGKRMYYYNENTDYKFNLLYIGEFKQFQRHGKGILYKQVNNEMVQIYDGQFEFDKYSGNGKAVFEKDLVVKAIFEKGKTREIKKVLYKNKDMEENKLKMFQ